MTAALSSDPRGVRPSGEWPVPPDDGRVPPDEPDATREVSERIGRASRRRRMGRTLRWVLAVVNLVLGLAGLALPFLQGVLHLVIGAALLAPDFPPARRLTLALFRKWPWIRRKLPQAIRDLPRKEPPACD